MRHVLFGLLLCRLLGLDWLPVVVREPVQVCALDAPGNGPGLAAAGFQDFGPCAAGWARWRLVPAARRAQLLQLDPPGDAVRAETRLVATAPSVGCLSLPFALTHVHGLAPRGHCQLADVRSDV